MIPVTQTPANQEPSPAGQCGSLSVIAGSASGAKHVRTEEQKRRRKELENTPEAKAKKRAQQEKWRRARGIKPMDEMTPERLERLRRQAAEARSKIDPEKQRALGLAHAARISAYKGTPGFEEKRKANRLRFVHSEAGRATVMEVMSRPGLCAGPGHINEKVWSVRDPAGRLHRFRNLCDFVRNNQALFAPEDVVPQIKGMATHWVRTRAYGGLASLRPSDGKAHVPGSWKGWTWATIYERAIANGADLLSRWPNDQGVPCGGQRLPVGDPANTGD